MPLLCSNHAEVERGKKNRVGQREERAERERTDSHWGLCKKFRNMGRKSKFGIKFADLSIYGIETHESAQAKRENIFI